MTKNYDAIIIGSGLGGLSCAATLARRGLRVQLLEKHTQPGGYASSFYRDRFEFEVSLHALSGIGTPDNPGPLYCQLEALDVAHRVRFISMDELYRSFAPDLDISIPSGAEAYIDALSERFPNEARGIRKLVHQVLTIGYEVDLLRCGGYSTSPIPTFARFPNMVHAAGIPLSTVLDRELTDPLAKLVFAQIWNYFGLPPSKLSFLMFACGLNMHLLYGSSGIEGKSQSLSNALAEVIREAGGEVTLSSGVSKIHVADERVCGVETEHGDRFETDTIIANVNPVTTLTQLIDPEHIPSGLLTQFSEFPPSVGTVNLYLGLSKPSEKLGIEEFETYLNRVTDPEEQYKTCLSVTDPGCLTLCAYDLINPAGSPKGTGLVTITALSEGKVWTEMDPDHYTAAKDKIAKQILEQVARRYPKVPGQVETLAVSTPITNMRFTGNPGGAIYGFANTPALNPGFRPSTRGPVNGLWFAGAWTQPGGGFQATTSSGIKVAETIIEEKLAAGIKMKPATPSTRQAFPEPPKLKSRKLRGIGLVFKDGKQVKQTIALKYKKHEDTPLTEPVCTVDDVVNRFHAKRLTVSLDKRIEETPDTVTLRFKANGDDLPPFRSGQYFSFHVCRDGVETNRPYSVSSPAAERNYIDITVKALDHGVVSNYLTQEIAVGDTVEITGPTGSFFFHELRDQADIVAIAVGSGITPFMSLIEDIDHSKKPVRVSLFYGARRPSDIIFHERLNELAKTRDWLTIIPVLSKPSRDWQGATGRISAKLLKQHLNGSPLSEKSFFICAPRDLYVSLIPDLQNMGVEKRQIRLEAYGPPADVTTEDNWPKDVDGQDQFTVALRGGVQSFSAKAGQTLLNSLEQSGVTHPSLCRSGICDSCKVHLESGEVFTPTDHLEQHNGQGEKYIRPCVCYPISNIQIIK